METPSQSELKFNPTTGDWSVNPDYDESGLIPHAYVLQEARGATREEAISNAALMQASPRLLAALEFLVKDAVPGAEIRLSPEGLEIALKAIEEAKKLNPDFEFFSDSE